jgi:hypothetical protein
MSMLLHHLSKRSCTVAMRSQSPFVLKNIMSVMGLFVANIDDSLSHRNRTDMILIWPDLGQSCHDAVERYDNMRSAGPSSGPPPLSWIFPVSCSNYSAVVAYSKED